MGESVFSNLIPPRPAADGYSALHQTNSWVKGGGSRRKKTDEKKGSKGKERGGQGIRSLNPHWEILRTSYWVMMPVISANLNGSGTGKRCCICARQTLRVHSPGCNTLLR